MRMVRIGDFSRLTELPIKTLRYYDALGLLRPARVEPASGYRHYSAAQLAQVNRILVFKDLGFSLREIRGLLADNVPVDQMRGMLRRKHDELERRVDRERARLARAAARLALLERSGQPAAHEVAVRKVGRRLVASVRGMLRSHDECARLFDEVDRHVGGGHLRRGTIWHTCAEGAIDCEAFVYLPRRVDGRGRVRIVEQRAQGVASLVYRGEVDYAGAYRAIRAWIAASGADVVGPKREIYLEDGGPSVESVTEIQFPIALAAQP